MIIVGGGSSSRFGGDKLTVIVGGKPLVTHAVEATREAVDHCVLVCRPDQVATFEGLGLGVDLTTGGATRTESEMAGLAALGGGYDLVGIHDAARPLVPVALVEELFSAADEVGGAVPVLTTDHTVVDRRSLLPMSNVVVVQTPQVFRGPELLAAFVRAARTTFEGHDTADVVQRFGDLDIAAIPGDPGNIKVTRRRDLEAVRAVIEGPSHSEPG